jgi:1-aminocyclopropane-1-carboxylate deaminase/D-cysteine desulfhydrase-like pyridoxal-dependent ACC family enzyme
MIQTVKDADSFPAEVALDVLRLDQLHPVVSGNKWFKLHPWINKARQEGYEGLASFGGPWSNHLHALAWAAREAGLRSVGYVRGYPPTGGNPLLYDLQSWGMELFYLAKKTFDAHAWHGPGAYQGPDSLPALPGPAGDPRGRHSFLVVPTGGYGREGMLGAARIWEYIPKGRYTHVYCAVGSGTMMAGLLTGRPMGESGMDDGPQIIGIPVMPDMGKLEAAIRQLLPGNGKSARISLDHRHHGGGYAKTSPELLAFMRTFYDRTGIPTDIIYTSKLMFAVERLQLEGVFAPGSRVLAIHSGGLQGNRSLPPGTLHW